MPRRARRVRAGLGARRVPRTIAGWRLVQNGYAFVRDYSNLYTVESSTDGSSWTLRATHATTIRDEVVKLPAEVVARYWRLTDTSAAADHWLVNAFWPMEYGYEPRSERGVPGGHPTLDAAGKVPVAQLPPLSAPAVALDELSDVTLTAPAEGDRLRFDGSVWRNDPRVWLPLTSTSGGDAVLVWDADNNLVITETTP